MSTSFRENGGLDGGGSKAFLALFGDGFL
jgi:hypothetical protein